MSRFFRISLIAAALAVPVLAVAPSARAFGLDTVFCTNCDTQATGLASLGKQAAQYAAQLQQYQTQLAQYQNMLTNTVALPMSVWGTVQSDIMQVQSLSNASALLSGNAGGMLSRLQGAGAYANQVGSLANLPGQLTAWQQTIGSNLDQFGKTLGLQEGQQRTAANVYVALQQHSQSAVGQMQALQAANELAAANGRELIAIQQTLATQAQMQATNEAVTADRRASEDAAMLAFSQQQDVGIVGRDY